MALFAAYAVVYGAALVLGVLDDLIWLPQLIAPSVPLGEIYAVLGRVGSAPGVVAPVVLWFLFWGAAGLACLVLLLPAHDAFRRVADSATPAETLGVAMTLLGTMMFFEWCSGFGMGMEVSDELPPYVGDTTPFGLLCLGGGFLIAVMGGGVWIGGAVRSRGTQPHRSRIDSDRASVLD